MENSSRPNIIFISAEQQRGDTVHYTGADWMITPHMDSLAAESVVFGRAFSCASTCIASRAAFYTGLYPHNTGMYCFYRSSGKLHWLNRLSQVGYHCTSIGKTHLPHMGFEESIAEQGNKYERYREDHPSEWQKAVLEAGYELPLNLHETLPDYYDRLCAVDCPVPEELHPDFFVTGKVMDWLDRQEIKQPFYLHIGLLSPHDLYDPPQRFLDMYDDEDIPMPDVTEEELAGIPEELFAAGKLNEERHYTTNLRPSHATPERIRRMRKHYYASVTMIDEKIGEIIAKLKEKGLYENSIIIFTSDHGDNLFDHGLFYKGELFDTITHIPLMIKSPGGVNPGIIRSDLVSHLDVARYILDKAGIPSDDLDGMSLVDTVEHGKSLGRTRVFAEEGASGLRPEPDLIAMMRSDDFKLIYFVGSENGQLFDLRTDPKEKDNLWNRLEYKDTQSLLIKEMLDWLYSNLFKHRDLFIESR